jgi:Ala-tRNA(Pro) deacylase
MAIATTLRQFLAITGVPYDVVTHPRTESSSRTAQAAHIPGDELAKSVLLRDERGYVLAVVPSTRRVELGALERMLDRELNIASESEVANIFSDCDIGAVPPVGVAYGVDVVYDDRLDAADDLYFEAGDHCNLVHINGDDFTDLMRDARHGQFTYMA